MARIIIPRDKTTVAAQLAIPARSASPSRKIKARTLSGVARLVLLGSLVVMVCWPVPAQDASPSGGAGWSAPSLTGLTLVAPESVPKRATFYRIQRNLPPLPMNNQPGLPVYWLGDNRYLIDDRTVDYLALAEEARAEQVLRAAEVALGLRAATPGDAMSLEEGEGTLGYGPQYGPGSSSTNDLWLEITNVTANAAGLIIHIPTSGVAGATNGVYDLYCTTNLAPVVPWFWLLRTELGQTNLTLSDPPRPDAYYILGATNDSDGGGLPDAWEHLITHGNTGDANDDRLPTMSIAVVDSVAVEQAGVSNTASFVISRPAADATNAVTVGLQTNGTATWSVDYELSPVTTNQTGQLCATLEAGVSNLTVWLVPIPDNTAEGTETATLTLVANWPGYRVDPAHSSATARILEDYTKTYTTTTDFNQGAMSGLEAVNDQLQFKASLPAQFPFINVACSGRGTVARINTTDGQVVGEYRTAPDGLAFTGADGDGPQPSRTTVDQYGNVWVANRDDTRTINGRDYGSITRIGLIVGGTRYRKEANGTYTEDTNGQYVALSTATYNTCLDRDGDSYIRTSRRLTDILPWSNPGDVDSDGGVSSAEDEAITEYTRVPCTGTRTIAVDKFNDIWVGGHSGSRTHLQVNGLTGQPVPDSAFDADAGGYGGVIDSLGHLWSSDSTDGKVMWLRPPTILPPHAGTDWQDLAPSGYGIAADPVHPYIWQTYQGNVFRWHLDGAPEQDTNGTTVYYAHGSASVGRGLAVDARGHVWVAHGDNTTTIGHLDTNGVWLGNVLLVFNGLTGNQPVGVSVDAAGKIWAANLVGNNAMRIDPDAGEEVTTNGVTYHVGAVDMVVALGSDAAPYNYSDMTGFNNRIVNPGGQRLKGYWSVVNDSGILGEWWQRVSWSNALPTGCAMEVQVRASDDRATLANGTFLLVTNDTAIQGVKGRFIEVRVVMLREDASQQPVLYDLTLFGESSGYVGDLFIEPASVYETEDAWFYTDVIGPEPTTYQWFVMPPWTREFVPLAGETNAYLRLPHVDLWDDWTLVSLLVGNAAGETLRLGPAELAVYPLSIRIPGGSTNSTGPAERYPATINVRGEPTNGLSRVEVTLHNLRHAYPADLDILLVSPSGTKIMLMSDAGSSFGMTNATLVFHPWWQGHPYPPENTAIPDDQTTDYTPANHGLPEETQLPGAPAGPYTETLDNLPSTDLNPNGIWKLYIYDDKTGQTGALERSWSLQFFYQ